MSEGSITLILSRLRQASSDEERQAAAAQLYRCYRGRVEQVARGRLLPGGGLADEEDVAQSAFRSFFDRIETGQLDALVNGGQAWAILARLTRNKAIDSVRYDNALCRGGEGARRAPELIKGDATHSSRIRLLESGGNPPLQPNPSAGSACQSPTERNRLPGANAAPAVSSRADQVQSDSPHVGRREEFPLDAVRDRTQRSGDDQVASDELIARFLEQLSEATLRGIVTLKMHGFTNEEIAEKLGCATRTVERKLNLIRRLWVPILEDSDERVSE